MSIQTGVFIIAEAGVNHNGSVDMARKLVDVASEAGADAVKFQTFSARKLVSRMAAKAGYQVLNTGNSENQLQMLERLELDADEHHQIAQHCRDAGIEFMSTAFDEESLDFLVGNFNISRIKIPSGEITNGPYLLHAAKLGKPMLLSTGMSTTDEIATALGIIAFGCIGTNATPSLALCARAAESVEGQEALRARVTLLHCTTEYPTPFNHVNLRAMRMLASCFRLPAGYSDHTHGITVPVAAAALGAVAIEKHLSLDRTLPGPDHLASLEPGEFQAMVRGVREVEVALGSEEKGPTEAELANRVAARRSLVATRRINKGETFSPANIAAKRPGSGLSPLHYWEMLGKPSGRDYDEDEMLAP
jgi:N-acetylneuraminate synthase